VCMLFLVIVGGFLMNDDVLGIHDCILTPAFLPQIEIKGTFESAMYSVMQDNSKRVFCAENEDQ
jgi:hypothetical protein